VGQWHDIVARWGGFNDPNGKPYIELVAGGATARLDDPKEFGGQKQGSQGLAPRGTPKTYYFRPNTELAFGGRVQLPGAGLACDIAEIEVLCLGRARLAERFERGLERETGSGALRWRFTPVGIAKCGESRAVLTAGPHRVSLIAAYPTAARLVKESLAYAPAGFAGSSLKSFVKGVTAASAQVTADAGDADAMVMVFADERSGARVRATADGFELAVGKSVRRFTVQNEGQRILSMSRRR
jgi:hypothetical protein